MQRYLVIGKIVGLLIIPNLYTVLEAPEKHIGRFQLLHLLHWQDATLLNQLEYSKGWPHSETRIRTAAH